MSRRSLIGIVIVAVAGMALASSAVAGAGRAGTKSSRAGTNSSATSTRAGSTVAAVYRPFSASGRVLMSVKSTKSGYCWTSSETTPRRDAWRCLIGNFIYDPCFSSSAKMGVVLCPTAPWSNAGIDIRLTTGLPTSAANHGGLSLSNPPWALQLTGGRDCVFSGGATAAIGGRRLNYFCGGLSSAGLWGYPDRRVEPWTICEAPASAKRLTTTVTIRRAWM
jgi:hypothetical protein